MTSFAAAPPLPDLLKPRRQRNKQHNEQQASTKGDGWVV